jgi:hypothetical protein
VLFLALTVSSHVLAQPFSSGSTGSDGALSITAPGVTYLDPVAMNLNPQHNNIFNFTTINIANGSILKISEYRLHGAVYFLAQGDVTINGVIDLRGDNSPGPTATVAEQSPVFAGSGGYSGGLGGILGDANHPALAGNGPGGGAAGTSGAVNCTAAAFTPDRYLVPLGGGSGGGGSLANGQVGAQGGSGGGALLIASSTTIRLDGAGGSVNGLFDGDIYASGGSGPCGGAGGGVRLVANSIIGANNFTVTAQGGQNSGASGLIRLEANSINFGCNNVSGNCIASVPFALNLPTAPPAVVMVASINGVAINANPFSFPDTTINSTTSVPVVINATNLPTTATVTLYLLSDSAPNQSIPVTMQGNSTASSATISVPFPSGATRGFVKATW